jgi:hypothetical protein
MTRCRVLALSLVAALAAAAANAATAAPGGNAAAAAAAGPAEWRSWDLLVDFKDLPQAYTCTELWYRLHDLLLAIGARHYPQIFTYHCGSTRAESSRSPSVELQFQLPRALSAADARYADVPVVRASVRLAPGTPRSYTAEDCELLKQLSTLLLPALPVHPVGAGLTCPAPGAARRSFALEVQALIPRS